MAASISTKAHTAGTIATDATEGDDRRQHMINQMMLAISFCVQCATTCLGTQLVTGAC